MSADQVPLSAGLSAMMTDLPAEVQAAMRVYRPHRLSDSQWAQVREPVLALIPLAQPPSVEAFHKQMVPLVQFAVWTLEAGFSLDVETMVTAERVETFREVRHAEVIAGLAPLSKTSINDYVSRLRMMGPKLNPNGGWPPRAGRIPGGVAKGLRAPYTDAEITRFAGEVATMPASPRRDLATALLALGLGFGPTPGEMAAMTAANLEYDRDGLWACVDGSRARRVPVAQPWADHLQALAARYPSGPFIRKANHKNALGEACRSLRLGRQHGPLSPMRLRITWMVDRLRAGADARKMCQWAGLTTLSSIPELVEYLPEPDPVALMAAMRSNPRTEP